MPNQNLPSHKHKIISEYTATKYENLKHIRERARGCARNVVTEISSWVVDRKPQISTLRSRFIAGCSFAWPNENDWTGGYLPVADLDSRLHEFVKSTAISEVFVETLYGDSPLQIVGVDFSIAIPAWTIFNDTYFGEESCGEYIELSIFENEKRMTVDTHWADLLDSDDLSEYRTNFDVSWNQLKSWSDNFDQRPVAPVIKLFNSR